MFKKKKNKKEYDINIYPISLHSYHDKWQYDVHLDGKLIKSGCAYFVSSAKARAQEAAEEHAQSGKYKYSA